MVCLPSRTNWKVVPFGRLDFSISGWLRRSICVSRRATKEIVVWWNRGFRDSWHTVRRGKLAEGRGRSMEESSSWQRLFWESVKRWMESHFLYLWISSRLRSWKQKKQKNGKWQNSNDEIDWRVESSPRWNWIFLKMFDNNWSRIKQDYSTLH